MATLLLGKPVMIFGKSHVRQHQRTTQTGKVETVREHERHDAPGEPAHISKDTPARLDDTALVAEAVAARVDDSPAFIKWASKKARDIYQANRLFRQSCDGKHGNDYLYQFMQHWHDQYARGLRKSVALTFGKSTVKQHLRQNKSGKASTVKQYTDSRTKTPAGSEGPKNEPTKLGIGLAITKVGGIHRHRNGKNGSPFDVVTFRYSDPPVKPKPGDTPGKGPKPAEPRQMVAVVFDEPGHIAVFDATMLGEGKVAFGDNSWRGDQFEQPLRAAIEKQHKDLFPDRGSEGMTTNAKGERIKVTIPPKETEEEKRDSDKALDEDHKRQDANAKARKPAESPGSPDPTKQKTAPGGGEPSRDATKEHDRKHPKDQPDKERKDKPSHSNATQVPLVVEVDVTDLKSATAQAEKAGLQLTVVRRAGAGGNPLVHLKGPREQLQRLLVRWGYDEAANDEDFEDMFVIKDEDAE